MTKRCTCYTQSVTDSLAPLAERMRPRRLEDIAGQKHLVGKDKPLQRALEQGRLRSILLWGPPGVGKTTIARLVAHYQDAHFVALSAVTSGVKDVRAVAQDASERLKHSNQHTILFLDEVHRFNKSQQDLLLPFVEDGTLTLIGATTENPSFEVNSALRSRSQLYVLESLTNEDLTDVLTRALASPEGFNNTLKVDEQSLNLIVQFADGDARRALNALELAASYAQDGVLDAASTREALSVKGMAFDKGGEHFYNLISALHKSVRGSDPDAALYWLARMMKGGADLMYVARRLVRMASEDIGLADPNALRLAVAARDAAQFLGQPEGELALAQATVYLAVAPKSNRVYDAWKRALRDAEQHGAADVPIHLRNAPTSMMKELGYGQAYAYYFDDPTGSFAQRYFPERMPERQYYDANGEGWEQKVAERLKHLKSQRQNARTKRKASMKK